MVYVLTFCIFAAVLLLSYRALGGEPASDDAVQQFVGNVADWLRADWESLSVIGTEGDANTGVVDQARAVRKKLSGYQQQLARLDGGTGDPVEAGRRAAVSDAIEALGWACRMVEAGSYATNPAVRAASAELYRASGAIIGVSSAPV